MVTGLTEKVAGYFGSLNHGPRSQITTIAMRGEVLNVSDNNLAWKSIVEGDLEGAIRVYDRIIASKPAIIELNNRGVAHILNGDLDRAARDFDYVRQLSGPVSVLVPFVGVCYWLQGKQVEACKEWVGELNRLESGKITHHDESGSSVPGLLWWASAYEQFSSFRVPAAHTLKHLLKQKWVQKSVWPGSIVPFLLGELSGETLHEAACRPRATKDLALPRRCFVAQFYEAANILDSGDKEGYLNKLRLLIDEFSDNHASLLSEPEYYLALAESQQGPWNYQRPR